MDVRELKNLVQDVVTESLNESLSTVYEHILEHDCATISAFRNDPTDATLCVSGKPPSTFQNEKGLDNYQINIKNNRELKAALLSQGLGVRKVKGAYIENFKSEDPEKPPIEVSEASLFVMNLPNLDQQEFFDIIINLGKKYCQDSVLLIPKGGQQGAFLYGTNNGDFPGLDQKATYEKLSFGKKHEFMSKIRNRPFAAINEVETYNKLSRLQRMAVKAMAHKVFNG